MSSESDYGDDIDDDDDSDDDDDDDGFICNPLERPEAQMLCFTMNSRLVFKTIEKALVLKVRQVTSAEIELRWTPPTEPLTAQVSSRQGASAEIKLRWTPPTELLIRQGSSGRDSGRY